MGQQRFAKGLGVLLCVLANMTALWAGGAQEKETQVILVQPPAYIAPGKPETGSDKLIVRNIQLQIDKAASIKSYTLNIYNKRGQVVYSVADAKLEGRGFFGELLNLGEVPQVQIPATMNWPGTDMGGKILPDGEFFYQLTILDSYGKKTSSAPLSVTIDTRAPQISRLGFNYRVFSPNGDHIRDTITFFHTTDTAWKWTQEIRTEAGNVVWHKETTADGDTSASDVVMGEDLVWDGTANVDSPLAKPGELVPENVYVYVLTGLDRARNKVEKSVAFTLSNSQGDLALGLKEASSNIGPGQSLTFLPRIEDTKGLVSWKLDITNESGIVWRRFTGTGQPPKELLFNAKGQPGRPEGDAQILKDGRYAAVLSGEYDSGTWSSSDEVILVMDSLPPQAWVSLDSFPTPTRKDQALVFGGGLKPQLVVRFRYENGLDWKIRFQRLQGLGSPLLSVGMDGGLKELSLKEFAAQCTPLDSGEPAANQTLTSLTWNGSINGANLEDGLWEVSLTSIDKAGNVGISSSGRFILDKRPRSPVAITFNSGILLPGLKQDKDVVKLGFDAAVKDYVEAMTVQINAPDGKAASSLNTQSWIPSLTWDGTRNNGSFAADGQYSVKAVVQYLNGDTVSTDSPNPIFLSRTMPNAKVVLDRYTISPNHDGRNDTITFTQTAGLPASWTGKLLDSKGTVIKELAWESTPGNWTWDGLDAQGKPLADDAYRYQLVGVDAQGVAGMLMVEGIRIDNLSETLGISADTEVISPNDDKYLDTAAITPFLALPEDLKAWEVQIKSESGDSIRTFQGGSKLPARLVWDGKNDAGTVLDGVYHLTLSVEYKQGTAASKQAEKALVLVKTPPLGVVRVEPGIFSPDGDGDRDTVDILMDARASDRPIKDWRLDILDPTGQTFRTWSGTGMPPASITWNGKSESGELVQSAMDYTALFTLSDEVKNTSRAMTDIAVDILVMREGKRLRINIPSIEFSGNSSDLFENAQKILNNNLDTLRKLARILKRYDSYKISIEGHATYAWAKTKAEQAKEEAKELSPLSQLRALEVKQALTILGIQWDRMSVKGWGGTKAVVSHDDLTNRWKNRRVEFILEK